MKSALLLSILLAHSLAAAAAGQPHDHGVARLDVVVEPTRVVFDLQSPLDNIVGFERAPRTDAERERAKAALARLRKGAELFRIDAAAGCSLHSADLQAPVLEGAADSKGGHADVQGHYEFHCNAGAKAGHVEIGLFEAFAGLRRLDLQVVTPRGQLKARLNRPTSRLALVR
ncbi:MAG TPA: DUF2796 domain-containing protein [Rubrivivax sp.]|jgi:hypothetical protein|nr:DUF2796 domain-containing protein [Rubrivivax sp.]